MRKLDICLMLLSVSVFASSPAQSECSKNEAMQAEATAATLKTWDQVYESYKRYSHCDDGAIAEGYSESVSQLLARRWEQLPALEKLVKEHKEFGDFVVKHIDQTMAEENRIKILDNTSRRCPKNSLNLCKRISSASNAR